MICITGDHSRMKCTLFPPFNMKSSEEWEMGFLDLMTYNSIPNIEEGVNNKMYFGNDVQVSLPTGSYEIEDINTYIVNDLKKQKQNISFQLIANNNTLKSEILCTTTIDFTKPCSLSSILGFPNSMTLDANKRYSSPSPVSINKVDVIRVTCNIVRGSYRDGVEGHVLHEFYPAVGPGFKILEKPNSVKYLPINKQSQLTEFYITLEDQNGELVNFRGERINLRVDIRKKT